MWWLALLAALVTACDSRAAREDSTRAPAAVARPAATPEPTPPERAAGRPSCPPSELWTDCLVVESLERAGLIPRRDTVPVSEEPLTARGTRILIGTAELELYLYEDRAARVRDMRALDTTRYLGYTEPVSMQQLPTLIQAANLVAILHSRNDHQRERIGDALTAGPSRGFRAP